MSKIKNPIDRFIYGIRDSFKNIKRAFAESEVVHRCVAKFLPQNTYSKNISTRAVVIEKMLQTQNVVSTDEDFNTFYRITKEIQPDIQSGELILGYIFNLIYNACSSRHLNIARENLYNVARELLQKPDCDLTKIEAEIMKEVSDKILYLLNNISINFIREEAIL